ncbi:hypothetical protein A3K78_03625 [Candidatus Bathyarchaeota archaeon RBG_13_52_12]|nr:MAG: hypothetical protein A3K78_03625 [Candidatus Bathyarchaeota archaeon RBG_13_52_12]
MATESVVENILCSKCNKVVPKQDICPECGQVLDATTVVPLKTSDKIEDQAASRTLNFLQFRREFKKEKPTQGPQTQSQELKKPPQKSVKNGATKVMENAVPEVEKMTSQKVEPVDTELQKVSDVEKLPVQNVDIGSYTPDPYTKELVEKLVKQLRYEINLVQLFKEGQVSEEIFTRLFNGMTDEIPSLIAHRGEATKELSGLMNGYKSVAQSAQQGLKLLDLRRSFDDCSDEEYKVKAAALNWDVDHYGKKISEGQMKTDYLRSLGGLIQVEEVNDLKDIAAGCMEASSMKHIHDSIREKIKKAMQETSSILNDVYGS